MKRLVYFFYTILLLMGCNTNKTIHMYSSDKAQCITIINKNNFRFIVNGKTDKIPDSNYIKLDMQNVDPICDGLYVCWKGTNKWDIVIPDSKIIESKLDTLKYCFKTALPLNDRGFPTEIKFRGKDCAIFDFSLMRLSPPGGAIIEY